MFTLNPDGPPLPGGFSLNIESNECSVGQSYSEYDQNMLCTLTLEIRIWPIHSQILRKNWQIRCRPSISLDLSGRASAAFDLSSTQIN